MILFLLLLEKTVQDYLTKAASQREKTVGTGLVPPLDLRALAVLAVRKEADLLGSFL